MLVEPIKAISIVDRQMFGVKKMRTIKMNLDTRLQKIVVV